MGIDFLFPELLLLIIPLLFLFFWRARARGLGGIVRIAVLVGIALLAAIPLARIGGRGVDVVVVADLSRSMPAGSRARELEIVKLLEEHRAKGDRVGIVTFGREARIERLPEEFGMTAEFGQTINLDGSDLGGAIGLAASLIPRERPGRLIVLSDGEANGAPVSAAAHDAAARGLQIDFRGFSRGEAVDIAVASIDVPGVVDELEPFQFSATVQTNRTIEAEAVLSRDGIEIARRTQTFSPGSTQLLFRDVIDRPGLARYKLQLSAANDRIPENNAGEAVLRVNAPPAILLVNGTGAPDNLARALASARLRVDTVPANRLPATAADLLAYRAVILDNVSANQIGSDRLTMLTHFVNDLGGGLLMTGGNAAFGVGGYFKSELDPYLPVSMEIKNEHRKLSLAMVVVLDRSGSMAAPVGDGRTKMDLANLGTCAAIDTLSAFDEVGVVAVDSAAHLITPLTSGARKDFVCDQVRGIRSLGGGIFVYTGLVSAARVINESNKGTRHIVLFADAADSEEPGEYQRLLADLQSAGITVSVIGLGSESDSDADFLKDVAARGGGRIQFTTNVAELPRLFAQEAITVARSSFVSEPAATHAVADMVLLGDLPASKFPTVDGYNLSYLRPGATLAVVTDDEYHAPVLAFWHRGLGRIAALTAEVDGKYSQSLNAWKDFGGFSAGLGRWLLGGDPPSGVRATLQREGSEGVIRVELDPDRKPGDPADIRAATAAIVPPGGGPASKLSLTWIGQDTLTARFPIQQAGIYAGAVDAGRNQVLPLEPLTLPYSPEFEPRQDPAEGPKTLAELARVTGGSERNSWNDAFSTLGLRSRQVRDLVFLLALTLLLLHLLEIAGRRLMWFSAANARLGRMRIPSLRLWRAKRAVQRPKEKETSTPPAATPSIPTAPPPLEPAASAMERAKAKARDRM
jgi:Mg-chelatase subunit ChlD/uncharacterized membrane protein